MEISETTVRSQRRCARRTGALLGVLLAAAAGAQERAPTEPVPEPLTLEALMKGMASAPGVVARFREVKELGLLSAPLETRGTLYFVPPDRLARVTTEPSRSRLVIDGERFAYRDEAGGEVADVSSSPLAREFVKSFIVLFNGDLESLRKRYAVTFRVASAEGARSEAQPSEVGRVASAEGARNEAPRWSLALTPRDRRLAEAIERILLEGSGRALERIELRESDGDRSVTTFEEVDVDRRFDEAELERIFSVAGNAPTAP